MSLGTCFASALPDDYFENLKGSDFLNYFPNVGISFQPNENQTNSLVSKINSLAVSQSSQENYVFSTLNDLALYYSSFSSLNIVKTKTKKRVILFN
jgi:hypothetical protein